MEQSFSDEKASGFYAFAYAQYHSGNWQKAENAFSVLCAKRPLEAKNWFGLGATLQESGKFEGALNAWAMTALLDPADPYPHYHAAECCLSLKKMQDAKRALNEARLRTSPSHHSLADRISVLCHSWAFEENTA